MRYASLPSPRDDELSSSEWDELQTLRKAISYSPSTVHPDKMERFTELFAKSLANKGCDTP